MRPITRGSHPVDKNGTNVDFAKIGYVHARKHMIEAWGQFCSYCEIHDPYVLQVEHIVPKSLSDKDEAEAKSDPTKTSDPSLRYSWDNFLLGCERCNLLKSNKDTRELDQFLWPDRDNTHAVFEVKSDGFVHVRESVNDPKIREQAEKLIELVGLNNTKMATGELDPRYQIRLEKHGQIYNLAKTWANVIKKYPPNHELVQIIRQEILAEVKDRGLWSLYIDAFRFDEHLIHDICQCFPGTWIQCLEDPTPKRGQI